MTKKNFQLNKGDERNFDISKGSKRRFDLTKDVDEAGNDNGDVAPSGIENGSETAGGNSTGGGEPQCSKKWLWIILAVLAIGLLAWWLWPASKKSDATENTPVAETAASADSSADSVAVTPQVDEMQTEGQLQDEAATPDAKANPAATPAAPAKPAAAPAQPADPAASSAPSPVNSPAIVSNDIEAEARKVIRGDYGVGRERKEKLGAYYRDIQRRVNQLKRQGAF